MKGIFEGLIVVLIVAACKWMKKSVEQRRERQEQKAIVQNYFGLLHDLASKKR